MVKSHLLHNGALAKSPRLFFYFFDLHSIIKRPTPLPLDLKRRSCVIYDRPHRCDSDATRSDHKYLPLLGVETNNTTELAICIYRETTFGYFSSTIVTLNRGRLGFCVSSQLILYIGFLLDYKSSRRFFFRAQIKPAERERVTEGRKREREKWRQTGWCMGAFAKLPVHPERCSPFSRKKGREVKRMRERGVKKSKESPCSFQAVVRTNWSCLRRLLSPLSFSLFIFPCFKKWGPYRSTPLSPHSLAAAAAYLNRIRDREYLHKHLRRRL